MKGLQQMQAPGLSLQASAPYNAVREAADLERRVNKALQMRHGQLFTATVRARQVGKATPSVNAPAVVRVTCISHQSCVLLLSTQVRVVLPMAV